MPAPGEHAALIALLRAGRRPWARYGALLEEAGSAIGLLEEEQGLLAAEEATRADEHIERWRERGMRLVTVLDDEYPRNLRAVPDHPPILFVWGRLLSSDMRAVAVVGSREASSDGRAAAAAVAEHLAEDRFTVVSGLAAGVDTAAHRAALAASGRTIAVLGTGLGRTYPPENAPLEREIVGRGAVISQFWPDAPPTRRTFPMRNAVMSGLARATVIVEASPASGSALQARLTRDQGRPVVLFESLLDQAWARALAQRPGVHVVGSPSEVSALVQRVGSIQTLTSASSEWPPSPS